MKKYFQIIIWLCFLIFTVESQAQLEKRAQTGFKFLSVSTDARVSGMGDAVTSLQHGYSSAMFYNPAGMANMEKMVDAHFGHTQWIAGINYINYGIAIQPFKNDNYGVLGFSVVAVKYGDMQRTIKYDNEQGYLDLGTFDPIAISMQLGYAKMLSNKFSIGGNIKWCQLSLGTHLVSYEDVGNNIPTKQEEFEQSSLAFDFGLIYQTGFKSLNLGMSVRNFSQEVKFIKEEFQLPLTFQVGVSMDMLDLFPSIDPKMHSFLLSVDAAHPRDFDEQLNIGCEYSFMDMVALRAGYTYPADERDFTFGAGVMKELSGLLIGVDYSYSPFGVFDNVHRISVHVAY
ncbi:MAG: PorV/PorQ family protein [Ignavibacteriales bacterium]|nr:PorV/PorQ family protein [Ignavibacteriales bacterium]